MIFRHFWDVEARLGRVLAFREERIQKFVDRRDFWPFENLQNFLHFLLKEKWVIHFATFSAATHPMRVFPNSAWSGVEGAIVCWPWNLWSGLHSWKTLLFLYLLVLGTTSYSLLILGYSGRAAAEKCARENWVFRPKAWTPRIYSDRAGRELNTCKISAP